MQGKTWIRTVEMTLLIGRLVLVCLLAFTVLADEPFVEQKPGPVAVAEPVAVTDTVAVADTVASVIVPETKTKFFPKPSTDSSTDFVKHEIIVIPNAGSSHTTQPTYGGHIHTGGSTPTHSGHGHSGGSPPSHSDHGHSGGSGGHDHNNTHGHNHNQGSHNYPIYYQQQPYPYQPYYPPQSYYPQYPQYIPHVYAPVPSIPSIPTYPSLPTISSVPSLPYYPQQGYYQKPIVISSGSSGSSSGKPTDGLWSLLDQKHSELFGNLFGNKGGSSSSDNKIHEVVVINTKPGDYSFGSGYDSGYGHGHGHGSGYGQGSGYGTNQGWYIKGKHAHSSDCNERK